MIINKLQQINIPKLGCGLDGLSWIDVKQKLYKIFEDTNIQINIYIAYQKTTI